MTVKRGKYVREVIEILHDHGPQTIQEIAAKGQMTSEYYERSVLSRLIEEAEAFYDPATKKYRLGQGVKPTWSTKDTDITLGRISKVEDPMKADIERTENLLKTAPPTTYNDFKTPEPTVVMAGDKIPRHKATELVLGLAWLQDMPDIDSVLAHYCDTHKAKFAVVHHKEGDRVEFSTKE